MPPSGSAKLPTSKNFWYQTAFISFVAIVAAYNVKQNIHLRKRRQYRPDELEISQYDSQEDDISKIRPGFPTANMNKGGQDNATTERKSEFEGSSDSYLTKKRGDKFSTGIWGK